jgi:hypothetical protein
VVANTTDRPTSNQGLGPLIGVGARVLLSAGKLKAVVYSGAVHGRAETRCPHQPSALLTRGLRSHRGLSIAVLPVTGRVRIQVRL